MNTRICATCAAALLIMSSLLLLCTAITAAAQTLQDTPPTLQDSPPALQDLPPPRRTPRRSAAPAAVTPAPPTPSNSVEDIVGRATGQAASAAPAPAPTVIAPNVTQPAAPLAPSNSSVARLLSSVGIPATAAAVSGADPNQARTAITRLEASYGLSPEVLNMRDTLPADPDAIIRQLNLHNTPVRATNFSNRTPTVEEIVQALQLR